MNPATKSSFRRAVCAGVAAVVAGTVALPSAAEAQNQPGGTGSELNPPVPAPPQKVTTNFAALAEAFFLAALIVGVNLIPSKRGHQD